MSEPDLDRIEALFQEAADLPAGERAAWLARACPDDPGARTRVQAMLAELERGGSLPPPPALDPGAAGAEGLSEGPGTRIARYRILQKIGEGGFGVVYMAEQTEPIVRRVALKIIKLGMDTREVVARFEAERQALALMDHPHIARVLDGGATESGRPYFVMELVRGVSITEYCDQNSLSTRDRLELFLPVCHAVQHAHQKGVIHRDLKPTNVMVTLHDGRPVPKVIDFGVAKAMHARLTEKTLFTAYERFIGTPAYMSPEQAELSGLDVDTRTDVYSLGVLLYELLTGTTPFDPRQLLREGLSALQRTIREQPPERPSVRISTSADVTVAGRRCADVPALSRLVHGDLDWIVLRCLEKDRARRYDSASELGADIERHLRNHPVLAGPPSAAYRLRKFLARNRGAVVSATVVVLGVVAGIAGLSLGLVEASRKRDEALAAGERAEQEARRSRAVTDFLVATLALTDPQIGRDPGLSVATLLQRAATQVDTALGDDPQAEARVRMTIGRAFKALGENQAAERHLRRAIQLARDMPGFDRGELYAGMWDLTHVLFALERGDAMAVAQDARRVAHEIVRGRDPALAETLDRLIEATNAAAFSMEEQAMRAVPGLLEESVRASDGTLPAGDPLWPLVADTWMAAGYTLWYGPLDSVAGRCWRRALEIQRRELQPGDPQLGETLGLLVGTLIREGRAGEAEAEMRETVESMRDVLPPDSPQLLFAESMLGANLASQGRFEEAEKLLVASHAGIVELIGDRTNFTVAESYGRVIDLYVRWGREEEARPYREQLADCCAQAEMLMPWPVARSAFGPEHSALLRLLDRMEDLGGGGHAAPAERAGPPDFKGALDDLLPLREARLAADHPLSAVIGRWLLGWSTALAPESADPSLRRMVEEGLRLVGPLGARFPFEVAGGHARLSELALADGAHAEAVAHARAAWDLVRDVPGDDCLLASTKVRVGRSLVRAGLQAEAEAALLPAWRVLAQDFGGSYPDTEMARELLFDLYTVQGRPEKAREFAASAAAGQ